MPSVPVELEDSLTVPNRPLTLADCVELAVGLWARQQQGWRVREVKVVVTQDAGTARVSLPASRSPRAHGGRST